MKEKLNIINKKTKGLFSHYVKWIFASLRWRILLLAREKENSIIAYRSLKNDLLKKSLDRTNYEDHYDNEKELDDKLNKVSKDKSATGGAAGGGMTEKGVKEYKRKNPGSNLQTAVTEKPSELKPGSKDAKRRKSYCARSKGWTGERGKAARRRWKC